MAKTIKVEVSTGWANGDHTDYWELPENWEEFAENEKAKFLDDCASDYLHECCSSYAEVVEEED